MDAGMTFPGDREPFEGARADAVTDQNVLLARMRCGATQGNVSDLAGLGATPIQERGTVDHIPQQDTEPCHTARLRLCVRPRFF